MVTIEAAAHGLPTVAYATGGVVDAVADGISGRLLPPGEGRAFAGAVLSLLNRQSIADSCGAFARGLTWDVFGRRIAESC